LEDETVPVRRCDMSPKAVLARRQLRVSKLGTRTREIEALYFKSVSIRKGFRHEGYSGVLLFRLSLLGWHHIPALCLSSMSCLVQVLTRLYIWVSSLLTVRINSSKSRDA
jgi:hypothetical protein